MAKKKGYIGTWMYQDKPMVKLEDFPEGCIGFIYKISNKTNGRYYIGRKSLREVRNVLIAQSTYDRLKKAGGTEGLSRKTNKAKTKRAGKRVYNHYRKTVKESNWEKYTGSSKELNADIKSGDDVHREILILCESRTDMTYRETQEIICSGCLEDDNCYNGWVSAKIRKEFITKNQ